MATATEIIENCLDMLKDPHKDWHKDAKMLRHLNRALRDIARKSQSITSHTFLPVLDDIYRYPLPDDFLHALIVGYQPPVGDWYELDLRMDMTVDRLARSRYTTGYIYPSIYYIGGRSVVDRYVGYVSSIQDDGAAFALTADREYTTPAPTVLFFGTVKDGDRVLNVTDGNESILTGIDETARVFRHGVPTGGADNLTQVGDEIRLVSPQESRHVLTIAPKPTKDSEPGVEPLSLFYARDHRTITAQDLVDGNDVLEIDLEFEPALENRICQYASTERHDRHDQRTQLFKGDYEYEYDDAFPAVNKRVREAASLWREDVKLGVLTATVTGIPNEASPFNRRIA